MTILIINPNSNTSMTNALEPILSSLSIPDTHFIYFTAPPASPHSIDDIATSQASATVCLPHITPLLPLHDAFVIACYSPHPLIPLLQSLTDKPVIGIFQASVTHSLLILPPGKRFGVLTTGEVWEGLLSAGVVDFLGGGGEGRFAGVASTGLTAGELHRVPEAELRGRMQAATERLLEGGDVGVVCLGCAGLVGLEGVVRGVAGRMGVEVKVVDGVVAAALVAVGLIKCRY